LKKKFSKLNNVTDLIALPDDVVKDLSYDQSYGYVICATIIRSVIMPDRLAQSANRFTRYYVFKGNEAKDLKLTVENIVGAYYPFWFSYKVKTIGCRVPRYALTSCSLP
jgi:hypothetical protein